MRPIPRRRQRSCGMKSVKSVLVAAMVSLALEAGILSVCIAYAFARSAPMDIVCENLASLADSVSLYIASEIGNEIFALQALSVMDAIASPELTLEEKAECLVPTRDLVPSRLNCLVAGAEGNAVSADGARINAADRDCFRRAMRGETVVSDPVEDRSRRQGIRPFAYAAPIRGRETRAVTGAIFLSKDSQAFSELLSGIPIGQIAGPHVLGNGTGEAARLSGLSQPVRDRSQPIAKAAEGINAAVAEIAQNTGSNAEAIGALVDMTGKFKL